jgi:16S rRNA (cytosine1402-N4)-methyltransferase
MTTGRGEGQTIAAGGPARHIPVLRNEAMAALAVAPGGTYIDATFGLGGYTRALLSQAATRVLGIDRDAAALLEGAELVSASGGRLTLAEGPFGSLQDSATNLGFVPCDGIVFDIGLSSMQLDSAERGFSFQQDGPLDMRMGPSGRTAAEIVNGEDERVLADIFYYFGEERFARKIARKIVAARDEQPIATTRALADLVIRVVKPKPHEIHPATRVFQALRIAVNDELGELVRGLAAAEAVLRPGGRLVVVTFHSLEDRIVKQFLAERSGRNRPASRLLPGEPAAAAPTFSCAVAKFGKQPIVASREEVAHNPRARSAKLRAGERTVAPARPIGEALWALTRLPHLPPQRRS